METDGAYIAIFFWTLVACYLLWTALHLVIEPIYIAIFQRPMYLYFYPFPHKLTVSQQKILDDNLPYYRRLTDSRKRNFDHRVSEFLSVYHFHGKGIVVTDEMRIMVASTFVMLTFGMRKYLTDVFDKIIIYPESYHSTVNDAQHKGEFNPQLKAVVFSWKDFYEGYREGSDNLNLGIHEFGHVLHYHGVKAGDTSARIFAKQYSLIMKEVNYPPNAKKLVDSTYFRIYAYTNQFEFIAVILEHFFESPLAFKKEFPQLFNNVRLMINYRG